MFMPFFDLVAVPSGLIFDDGFNDEFIRRGGDIALILILERKPWAPIERSATASVISFLKSIWVETFWHKALRCMVKRYLETLSLRLYPVGVDECLYEAKKSS